MPLSPSASPASRPNKAERAAAEPAAYDAGIFVNSPFDDGYKPLFNATVFAVLDCGLGASPATRPSLAVLGPQPPASDRARRDADLAGGGVGAGGCMRASGMGGLSGEIPKSHSAKGLTTMMQDMGERAFCFVLGGALPVALIGFLLFR